VSGTVKTRIDFGRVRVYGVISLKKKQGGGKLEYSVLLPREGEGDPQVYKGQRLLFKHSPVARASVASGIRLLFGYVSTRVFARILLPTWLECLPNCSYKEIRDIYFVEYIS